MAIPAAGFKPRLRGGIFFRILPWLLLAALAGPPAVAQESPWSGRVTSLNLHLEEGPTGWSDGGNLSFNGFRLRFNTDITGALSFETAVETGLLATDPAGLASFSDLTRYRVLDLTETWSEEHSVSAQMQVDRLSLSGHGDHLQWTLGRQAIGFGRILLVSPLDVITPFAPDAIDTEIRPGVDALKVQGYFGTAGEIGIVTVFGNNAGDGSALLTFSWNTHGIDILGLAGTLRERPMGGVGLAGDWAGIGIKAEMTAYSGKEVTATDGDLHKFFVIGALEGWYRFANGLIVTGQYLYNGAGTAHSSGYAGALASAPVREGLTFLAGQHYLLVAPSYEIHPLVTLSGLLIWNLKDLSALLRPSVNISLSDNLDLMVFWGFALGRSPRDAFRARSEFGSRGDTGGLFLSWHF